MLFDIINRVSRFAPVKTIVFLLLAEKENWEQRSGVYFWQKILVTNKVRDSWVFQQLRNAHVRGGFSIPPRVKFLTITNYTSPITFLPETLKYLKVEVSKKSGVYEAIPKNLKKLVMVEIAYEDIKIPEGVESLKLYSPESLNCVPKSTSTLLLNGVRRENLKIPEWVKCLKYKFNSGENLLKFTIPTSVEQVFLFNYFIREGDLPNTLKKLVLSGSKGDFTFIPKSVEELIILNYADSIRTRDYEFEDAGNIKKLAIRNGAPKLFIEQFSNLKELVTFDHLTGFPF